MAHLNMIIFLKFILWINFFFDYNNMENNLARPVFDFDKMPVAYFCDTPESIQMRNQLIKNSVRISEDQISELPTFFFSNENIDLINKQLILSVYKKSNGQYKISAQSKEKLNIIMMYVYNEYARNLPYGIKEQIKELNCRVVGEILPDVLTNASQIIGYRNDAFGQRQINSLPQNTRQNTLLSGFDGLG